MIGHRRNTRVRIAAVAAVVTGVACGDPAEPNEAPVAVGEIAPVTPDAGTMSIWKLSQYFSDPNDDVLAYTAVSSNGAVASALVSGDTLNVTALIGGTATITATATDPGGLSATQEIGVTVPNQAPEIKDTFPVHDLFISASDPDTMSRVVLDLSDHFIDLDMDELVYTASIMHDSVARIESLEAGVITTVPVSVAGGSLWDSTTITVTATDPDSLSVTQEAQVRVAHADYEAWVDLEISFEGGFRFPGNNTFFMGCVPMDERVFGDSVYTVHRGEWQVRKGSGWVQVPGTFVELEVCSYDDLPNAAAGIYRLAGELSIWPVNPGPGDSLRVLRKSENVILIGTRDASRASRPDLAAAAVASPLLPARRPRRPPHFRRFLSM